jgi:hypothetical protein
MPKIDDLKKQYPEFDITLIDLFKNLDNTESNRYLPIICKLLMDSIIKSGRNYDFDEYFQRIGFKKNNLSEHQLIIANHFLRIFENDTYNLIHQFKNLDKKKLLENKDLLTYKDADEIIKDISISALKEVKKSFEKEIYKEFEDDKWVFVRPLTFEASLKYGAATKWCTTSINEKRYFAKYWYRGVLVYVINKETGYKFAIYKEVNNDDELSFWDASDRRIDSMEIVCENYIYDVIKKVISSKKTNYDLTSEKIRKIVFKECDYEPEDGTRTLRAIAIDEARMIDELLLTPYRHPENDVPEE